MVSANVTSTPVQNVGTIGTRSGRVGYMLFNDHIATAETLLIGAFSQLQGAGVSDLVLDIRYNGGGYLDIASEVAYMIAGPGPTTGKGFEKTVFNDKYPTTDPVTGGTARPPIPFHNTSQGFSGPSGQPLPTLNLARVFVLTSPNTCSASEAIVNGLRGVGVQVIQVGTTTCGKPYGFYPQDNCGTTYFTIEFQGLNAQGFGDYPDGFSPANTVSSPGVVAARLLGGRRLRPCARRSVGSPPRGGARLSRQPELPGGRHELVRSRPRPRRVDDRRPHPQVAVAREPDVPPLTGRARRLAVLTFAGLGSLVAACATAPPAQDVPAVIAEPTPESRAELIRVVSEALSRRAAHPRRRRAHPREHADRRAGPGPRPRRHAPAQGRETGRPEHFRLVKKARAACSCTRAADAASRSDRRPARRSEKGGAPRRRDTGSPAVIDSHIHVAAVA